MMRKIFGSRWILLGCATGFAYSCVGTNSPSSSCAEQGKQQVLIHDITFEELRNSVRWLSPRSIETNGKIIIYKNLLFILEPFQGIHVYDNTNNEAPVPLGFLDIPGNSDIYVKNDLLYADSYTDLVSFDISYSEPTETARLPLAFEHAYFYDEIGISIYGDYECL